jgi:hypothetical protein
MSCLAWLANFCMAPSVPWPRDVAGCHVRVQAPSKAPSRHKARHAVDGCWTLGIVFSSVCMLW